MPSVKISMAVILLSILFSTTSRAEPGICDNVMVAGDPSPFFGLDMVIAPIYIPRALCGLDISNDLKFWRSLYRHYGCSAASGVGKAIESILINGPKRRQAKFEQAKINYPENVEKLCAKARKCVMPSKFDPQGELKGELEGKLINCRQM